jgi:hypothetical protein
MATFELPQNGHRERVTALSGVAFFCLGPLYFLIRGMFGQALGWAILCLITLGAAWVVGWFMAPGVIATHLLRSGYRRVEDLPTAEVTPKAEFPPDPRPLPPPGTDAPAGSYRDAAGKKIWHYGGPVRSPADPS